MVDKDVARSWNSGSSQIAGLGITMPTLGKLEKYLSAGTTARHQWVHNFSYLVWCSIDSGIVRQL